MKYGAKKVLAFDYDTRTVDVAKKNLSEFKNANVTFESIYNIKYKNTFDIAFSIGVIQFLEHPDLAIKKLYDSIKKEGILLIWVYSYEGNEWIVKYVNPLRKLTSRMPLPIVHFIASLLTVPIYLYVRLIKQKKPYFKQLSKFNFHHINSIVFDQLIPKIAHYWRKDEALSLLERAKLKNIKIVYCNENSWTVMGRK